MLRATRHRLVRAASFLALQVAFGASCASPTVIEIYPGRYSGASDDAGDLGEAMHDRCPDGYDILDVDSQTVRGTTELRFQEWQNGVKPPDWDYKYSMTLPFESTTHSIEVQCHIRDVGRHVAQLQPYIMRTQAPACPALMAYVGACEGFALDGKTPPHPGCADVRMACAKSLGCDWVKDTCSKATFEPLRPTQLIGEWKPALGRGSMLRIQEDTYLWDRPGRTEIGIWSFRDGRLVLSSVTDGALDGRREVLTVVDLRTRTPILRDADGGYFESRTLLNRR